MKSDMAKAGKAPVSRSAANGGEEQGFSLIPREKLLVLYSTILKCRLLAERADHKVPGSPFDFGLGSEAAAAGITINLNPADIVIAAPQNPLPGLIKGLPLEHVLKGGSVEAPDGGSSDQASRARSMDHSADYPALNVFLRPGGVTALLTLATRVALASKVQSTGQIVVVFCGDHPQADESWEETLTFAGEKELPILFVCQERRVLNGSAQFGRPDGSVKDKSFGVPAISVDGNDAVAVFRVASESISRARLGRGPTLIDCQSFRLAETSTEQRPQTKHRIFGHKFELHGGMSEDGLANMEKYLSRKGLFAEDHWNSVTEAFKAEIDAALACVQVSHGSNGWQDLGGK